MIYSFSLDIKKTILAAVYRSLHPKKYVTEYLFVEVSIGVVKYMLEKYLKHYSNTKFIAEHKILEQNISL